MEQKGRRWLVSVRVAHGNRRGWGRRELKDRSEEKREKIGERKGRLDMKGRGWEGAGGEAKGKEKGEGECGGTEKGRCEKIKEEKEKC